MLCVCVCLCRSMNRVSIRMLVEQSNCRVPATAGYPVDITQGHSFNCACVTVHTHSRGTVLAHCFLWSFCARWTVGVTFNCDFSFSRIPAAPKPPLLKCQDYIADEFLQLQPVLNPVYFINNWILLLHLEECHNAENYIWAVCQNVMM